VTKHLVDLIDGHKAAYGVGESELARRIGISRQNLNLWRIRGVRQLPARTTLQGVADVLGCHYYVVLEAALRDSGYLGPADRIVATDIKS
jgi:transcriptional regulator with XRE-family HTH domain